VKFRKARIVPRRKRHFDQDRHLQFEHNRNIRARLQGVRFRNEPYAIGFRNIGVSNIEEAADAQDWPNVGPAKKPDSLVVERDSDYNQVWGRDRSYQEKWGDQIDDDWDSALDPADPIPPQLSYYHLKEETKKAPRDKRFDRHKKTPKTRSQFMVDSSIPKKKPKSKPKPIEYIKDEPAWASSSGNQPVYEVVEETTTPIIAQPSQKYEVKWEEPTIDDAIQSVRSKIEPIYQSVSPKDKKRAYAFNEYALNLMESGKYAKAMTYFQKARSLDPVEETYKVNMKRCQQWLDYKLKRGR
jgi:tetratricopeptide (TPR) repeat protein